MTDERAQRKARFEEALSLYYAQRLDEAKILFEALLYDDPSSPEVLAALGVTLHRSGDHETALRRLKQAVTLAPTVAEHHHAYAMLLLYLGQYDAGFHEYEWRLQVEGFSHTALSVPRWDGAQQLDKHLVILAEQGFGDNIQFARYLPWVKERVGRLTVITSPKVTPLLDTLACIDTLIDTERPLPSHDLYTSIASLPGLYYHRTKEILCVDILFKLTPPKDNPWQALLSKSKTSVGLVWQGRPDHENNVNRSMSLASLTPLFDLPNVEFVSLQTERVDDLPPNAALLQCPDTLNDFSDTAALIQQLDVVICVDTAVAHLAGSLGVPTWILLPFVAEWRWQESGETSEWYESVKLFRQTTRADWTAPVLEVRHALEALISAV